MYMCVYIYIYIYIMIYNTYACILVRSFIYDGLVNMMSLQLLLELAQRIGSG